MWGMGVFLSIQGSHGSFPAAIYDNSLDPSISAMCCSLKKFLGWEVAPRVTVLRWELLWHKVDSPMKRAMVF